MSCQVFRNDNNEIDRVEASNGEKSNLYDSILALPEIFTTIKLKNLLLVKINT
jgi:hypothetical protein